MTTAPSPPARIAIDTGGTFTDCVYYSEGRLAILKLPSTPSDPGQAVLTAVARIAGTTSVEVRHGTTVGTNTLLERKGARVAFVTTAGFEDTIAIGRQARPKLYDLFFTREEPLLSPELCFGVHERTAPDGTILESVEAASLDSLIDALRKSAPESVAVSLLFSFANPANERTVAEALRCLNIPISISHQVLPEFREYERGSTVLINAYLAPKMRRYIDGLDSRLAATSSRLQVMQSSGGIIPGALASTEPVRTILSGPAGGVVGAIAVAKAAGFEHILTFDMGGTSTDVALVDGDEGLRTTTESQILGTPVAVPMLRIHTVGAGGGSLAGFDRGGALKVGPESAGANPGPICFGIGIQPTVTDANLLLGRLEPSAFLDGGMHLDEGRARHYFDRAKGNLSDTETFAEGIIRLADTHMERALRHISVEAGRDPRDFTLVSFGGAGPLHACALAHELRISRVLVPAMPGALSAYGILVSDLVRDYSRTVMLASGDPSLETHFIELEQIAYREMHTQGLQAVSTRTLDLRYAGQGYELNVDAGPNFLRDFHHSHATHYGYSDPKRAVEVVNVRVHMVSPTRQAPVSLSSRAAIKQPSPPRAKQIYYRGAWLNGSVYYRSALSIGDHIRGPAVLVEYSATTFLPPEWRAQVDASGNLLLESA
jgi:N-methylhydantoinase A